MHKVIVNGQVGGAVAGDDPGLLLGLTVFETMRTYSGAIFRLDAHLERLQASGKQMHIAVPPTAEIAAEILDQLSQTPSSDAIQIRYTVTAGGTRILQLKELDASRIGAPIRVGRLGWDPPEC